MTTVPTLVATASIVGVSAVGYAIGRPEPQSSSGPPPNRRNASFDLNHHPMATQVTTRIANSSAHASPFSVSTNNNNRSGRRPSNDGRSSSHKTRRKADGDNASVQAADSHYEVSSPITPYHADSLSRATLHSRPSWIRRLSSRSSQHSSRTSSPQPLSPSLSLSNGSATFSNTSSSIPFLGDSTPTLLPPNKLVKRSSSHRAGNGPPSSSSSSRIPTLKRPATSHQRSATLQLRSRPHGVSSEEYWSAGGCNLTEPLRQEPAWRSYFGVKVAKEGTISRKRPSGDTTRIKRVFADDKSQPTLVMAKSVSMPSVEEDESFSQDGDSVFFGSRPATPFSLSGLFSSPPTIPAPSSESPVAPAGSLGTPAAEGRHKRSFSDLLSTGPSSWKLRPSKMSDSRPTQKGGRRVNSAPLISMGNRHSHPVQPELTSAAKHRDFSDPLAFQFNAYTTSNDPQPVSIPRSENNSATSSSALSPPEILSGYTSANASTPLSLLQTTSSTGSAYASHVTPSPTLAYSGHQPSQYSAAPSERALTLVGSDSEGRGLWSGDDDDTDFTADTVFDSLQTRTTRSTSGARGRHIETVFDEPLPELPPKIEVTALRDLLPKGTFDDAASDVKLGSSIAEEDESIGTAVHPSVEKKRNIGASADRSSELSPRLPSSIPSSPPGGSKGTLLRTPGRNLQVEEMVDDDNWCFDEDEEEDEEQGFKRAHNYNLSDARGLLTGSHSRQSLTLLTTRGPEYTPSTPKHLTSDNGDRDKEKDRRSNPFDWSEQQPSDKTPGDHTPPRPKTVHGKKDADGRGSRSAGRRVPSGIHARSQSVPVVPDVDGKRETVRNKFGTWGVGTKGVTEDWDDDFDFTASSKQPMQPADGEERRVDSGYSMVVPLTIKRQQTNVLANISLLKEWGMLIEELKELRIRAASVGMLHGQYIDMWREVDAMIDLADQEAEEQAVVPRSSPPSSPGLDMDAFEEEPMTVMNNGRSRRRSGVSTGDSSFHSFPSFPPTSHRHSRKSILGPDDVFSGLPSVLPIQEEPTPQGTPQKPAAPITRPRKDSEAVARSVIEALQNKRNTADPTLSLQPVEPTKKVPFDTATLKHIVPYVQSLVRKVKDALRVEEGLYSSPDSIQKPLEPTFSQIFQSPVIHSPLEESPSSRKSRRPKANSPSPPSEDSFPGLDHELSTKMRMMTVT